MILGDVCTRNCPYCAVAHGRPDPLDPGEPARVAAAAEQMQLRYVVITSVDRDDLPDGGASGIFAATIAEIRRRVPSAAGSRCSSPTSRGRRRRSHAVLDAGPDILNHNTETVPRLYRTARPGGRYPRTLELLDRARAYAPAHPDQVRPDGRHRRGVGRTGGDARRPALGRLRHPHHWAVPESLGRPPARRRATITPTSSRC